MYPHDDKDKSLSTHQHGIWSMAYLSANCQPTKLKELHKLREQRFIGLLDTSIPVKELIDYPTARCEAADVARARMEADGPPSLQMIADAARFADALKLKPEGNHWRGRCPMCCLPDSLTLTPRAMRCEVVCDSGVCSLFDLEADIDGRLCGRGILDFRCDEDFPWKAKALRLERSMHEPATAKAPGLLAT